MVEILSFHLPSEQVAGEGCMARVQVDRLFLVLLLDCSKLEEGWNSKNWSRVI